MPLRKLHFGLHPYGVGGPGLPIPENRYAAPHAAAAADTRASALAEA